MEFLARAARAQRCQELAAEGWLVARLVSLRDEHDLDRLDAGRSCAPGRLAPGKLGEMITGAVEMALALRGALPPAVEIDADARRTALDQLFRVRALGARGLCLLLPEMRALAASAGGALPPADTAAVVLWAELAAAQPVTLLFEEQDRSAPALSPQPLERCVGAPPTPVAAPAPAACEPKVDRSVPLEPARGRESAPVLRHDPLADLDRAEEEPVADACALGDPFAPELCLEYADDLDASLGPKPATAVEQLFRERYAPLCAVVARGLAGGRIARAVEDWRASFEKSYTESFAAMRVTGKRPRMGLDVPDLAARLGRLHGARSVQLLCVDGMRFDLGERVSRGLGERLGPRARCVDEALLWSALPTTTPVQLALLGRGPRGLRDLEPPSEREGAVLRGRSVAVLRRLRVGPRDLLKLDLAEARLREPGPAFEPRMTALAGELADVIARFAASLTQRTLLYVFGDHGFRIGAHAGGTGPAAHGGASPEEVLCGGWAWLVGEVH
jgi:hypothetical protein